MTATKDNRTVTCRVRWTDEWVEVESAKTKKIVRVTAKDYEGEWQGFSSEENQLFDKIMQGHSEKWRDLTLTISELSLFADVSARAGLTHAHTNGRVPDVETKAPAASQPTRTTDPYEAEQNRVAGCKEGYVLVFYDIPDEFNYLNPAGEFWRHGFSPNKSVWIMHTGQIPLIQDTLNVFKEHKFRNFVVPFAGEAAEVIQQMAREAFRSELVRLHTSLITSIGKAHDQFATAIAAMEAAGMVTEKERDKKLSYRLSRVKAMLKATGERLNSVVQSAMIYDETEQVEDLVKALRESIAVQTAAYNSEQEARMSF